jgi:hypothetical protein
MLFGCMGRLAALLTLPVAVFLASCDSSAPAGMGQEVLDGKFAFIVTKVHTSRTFGHTRAQGVYVLVSIAVRNVGTETQMFEWAAQRLKDRTGREYSASHMVPPLFGDVVNSSIDPGLQVSVKLAFDVPPGSKPSQIVLHESLSSNGAQVDLRQPTSRLPRAANGSGSELTEAAEGGPAASAFWRRRLSDATPTAPQDLEPLASDRSAALSESHELAPVS